MDDDFIDELWEEFDDIFEEHSDEELHEEELPDEWIELKCREIQDDEYEEQQIPQWKP